jgi:hypothetical protein
MTMGVLFAELLLVLRPVLALGSVEVAETGPGLRAVSCSVSMLWWHCRGWLFAMYMYSTVQWQQR